MLIRDLVAVSSQKPIYGDTDDYQVVCSYPQRYGADGLPLDDNTYFTLLLVDHGYTIIHDLFAVLDNYHVMSRVTAGHFFDEVQDV